MVDRVAHIPDALSRFINERDMFVARHNGVIFTTGGGPLAFNDLVNGHAEMLAHLLPQMNLAQWEALSELAASRLNQMRMIEQGSKP